MLFLVVAGGAIALEVHRAIAHRNNTDLQQIQRKEEELKRQLQVGGEPTAQRRRGPTGPSLRTLQRTHPLPARPLLPRRSCSAS